VDVEPSVYRALPRRSAMPVTAADFRFTLGEVSHSVDTSFKAARIPSVDGVALASVISSAVVGVGGLLLGASAHRAETQRDERARREETRRRYRDIAVACRLVANELDTITGNFRFLAERSQTLSRPIDQAPEYLPSREWVEHRGEIASIIDHYDTWTALTSVYHNAESLRSRILVDGPNAPIPTERLQTLEHDAIRAAEVVAVLDVFAQAHLEAIGSPGEAPQSIPDLGDLAEGAAKQSRTGDYDD
jgi:hypothetical protein